MGQPLPTPGIRGSLWALRHASDLATLLPGLHERFGPVVKVGRGPLTYIYACGAEANRFVLADGAHHFSWKQGFGLLEVVDGPTALVVTDGDEHRRRRRLVQPAFSIKRVDAQLGLIADELGAALDTWTPGRQLDAHADLRAVIRRIVVRSLFGQRLGELADRIGDLLQPALDYVQRSPVARLDIDLRVNGYARARRSVEAVDRLIRAEIDRRRREGVDADAEPDTLSALLVAADHVDGDAAEAGDETGDEVAATLTDAEICDQIRSLIAAGYDTTSAAAAWVVHALGANPEVLDRLRDEVHDAVGRGPLRLDALRSVPLADHVVRETLRLWPPGAVSPRGVVDDIELLGFDIPAGSTLLTSTYVTHRMPVLWGADAASFRPDRWADGEPEPFAYVPFGGAYRKCIGFALATLELQVLAVLLAQRVRWSGPQHLAPTGMATLSPSGGVPITVEARPR